MFTIIGADGQPYGPVTADKVREWIRAGRANAQTKAQRVGETEWSTLGNFTEFTAPPPADAPEPGAPPAATPLRTSGRRVEAQAYAAPWLAQHLTLDLGACLSRAWELLKSDFWNVVGVNLVMTLVIALAGSIPLLGLLLLGPLLGGVQYFYLRRLRAQPAGLSEAFDGFSIQPGALVLAGVVQFVLIAAGLICLILPGIYLAVAYLFTYLLVIDHGLDFWPAMEVSRRIITANWGWMLLLVIVAAVLSFLGTVAFVIGYVFTAPLFYGALVAAYEQLIGPPRSN